MSEQEMREALTDAVMSSYGDASAEQLADALLPVVRRIVAKELRAAADALDTRAVELWNAYKSGPITDPRRASPHTEGESDGWENAGTAVRARADALASP